MGQQDFGTAPLQGELGSLALLEGWGAEGSLRARQPRHPSCVWPGHLCRRLLVGTRRLFKHPSPVSQLCRC